MLMPLGIAAANGHEEALQVGGGRAGGLGWAVVVASMGEAAVWVVLWRRADARSNVAEISIDAIGDKLDAKITTIDKASRRVVLSVKARELDEEKKAMADFGSSDSGASLGDILGAALKKRAEADDEEK
jgi:small subunit ribosomal protein S1